MRDTRGPFTEGIAVRCDGCGHEDVVRSRSQFGVLEDLHTVACDVPSLSFEGTPDDVLDLPPF